jgi:hypothetical protein
MPRKRENPEPTPDEDNDALDYIKMDISDIDHDDTEEEEDEDDEDEHASFYALDSLIDEDDPMVLPREAFVLYTEVTDMDSVTGEIREGTLVVHNDRADEALYVLCFESLDAATDIQKEFELATGEEAMIRRIAVMGNLEDYFRIRFYHANGQMEDLTQNQYHERCL